jgi:hypothetical protein
MFSWEGTFKKRPKPKCHKLQNFLNRKRPLP